MQEEKVIICNSCKGKSIVSNVSKVTFCPYCGSKDIRYIEEEKDTERVLFGIKVDTNDINDKLLWIAFTVIVVGLFAFLFYLAK